MLGVREASTRGGALLEIANDSSSVRGTEPQSRTFTLTALNADEDAVSVAILSIVIDKFDSLRSV